MVALSKFQPYLQSLLAESREGKDWGDRYISTHTELPLQVQGYVPSQAGSQTLQPERQERFAVLEGLRKYTAKDREQPHVLLVGKPGSGKSTSLRRLSREEAEKCATAIAESQNNIPPIPLLLELRNLSNSILHLIQEMLEWQGVALKDKDLKILLRKRHFLLLLDGLNELPTEAARQEVGRFKQLCVQAHIPLIVTTRELGVGLDLSITNKLEMMPLTEPQLREFVQKQLPETGGKLLRQVQGRLREVVENPMLLKLLCEIFKHNQQQIPKSQGELFRVFAQNYDQIVKPWDTVTATPDFREFRDELLRELAAAMIQGEQPIDFRLQIDRDEAAQILEDYLSGRVEAPGQKAKKWLEDLIEHHLLQVAADPRQIEFHHHMFQEYYAAEWLLPQFKTLSNEALKYHYLNYLKWTEPLAMTIAFVQSETLAVRVVRLALEVDWRLGARLAGETNPIFHKQTVKLITTLRLPKNIKIELLGITCSYEIVNLLRKKLTDANTGVRWTVVEALGNVKSEAAVTLLVEALKDSEPLIRLKAVRELGRSNSETAVLALTKVFQEDESPNIVWETVHSLGRIGNELAVNYLLEILEYKYSFQIEELQDYYYTRTRSKALMELVKLDVEIPISKIFQLLKDSTPLVRLDTQILIQCMKNRAEIEIAIEEREIDNDFFVQNYEQYISSFSDDVSSFVNQFCGQDTTPLIDRLKHEDWEVYCRAAAALGELKDESAVSALEEILYDVDKCWGWKEASTALAKIGTERALIVLLFCLKSQNSELRRCAIDALSEVKSHEFSELLAAILRTDKDENIRRSAAIALGNVGGKIAETALLKTVLFDVDPVTVAVASEELGKIAEYEDISLMLILMLRSENTSFFETIKFIQARCKFYNYEVTQLPPPKLSDIEKKQKDEQYIFPAAHKVQIFERVDQCNQ